MRAWQRLFILGLAPFVSIAHPFDETMYPLRHRDATISLMASTLCDSGWLDSTAYTLRPTWNADS
jgi:hypothetical protein